MDREPPFRIRLRHVGRQYLDLLDLHRLALLDRRHLRQSQQPFCLPERGLTWRDLVHPPAPGSITRGGSKGPGRMKRSTGDSVKRSRSRPGATLEGTCAAAPARLAAVSRPAITDDRRRILAASPSGVGASACEHLDLAV